DTGPGAFLHGLDLTAPAVQVTDHVAHVLFRRGDLNRHDRLEENRVGFTGRLLEGHGTGDLEGELRGVHVVVGAVLEGHLDADQRVSSEDTELGGLLATSVYRRDVLPRDTTASDVVDELVARAVTVTVDRKRFEVDDHATVLAGATRLLLVGVLDAFVLAANRLAVGHLGLTDVGLDLELFAHPVDEHLEVQLAHTGDDGLTGLLVGSHSEGGVLLRKTLNRGT